MYKIAFILFFLLNQSNAFSQQENKVIQDSVNELQEEAQIYTFAEVMPKYPGGLPSLMKYLKSNLIFQLSNDSVIPEKVILKFYIDKQGSVCDVKLLKGSSNRDFDNIAIQVVNQMPQWNPATYNGNPVNCYYTLPIQVHFQ